MPMKMGRAVRVSRAETLLFMMVTGYALQVVPAVAETDHQLKVSLDEIEGIIVTARKRDESFQDVPIVATVIQQATLEQSKIDDLYAVASRTPGLVLGGTVADFGAQLSIHGIGTTGANSTMDQSVSLNIDGLQLTQGNAYSVGMFDVAQVEILKGPQSLFFGKNNTAGVISLRSADPTDEFEMIARLGYEGEAEEKEAEFILSGPVSDTLRLRLAGRYSDQEGYFVNEAEAIPGLGGRTPEFRNMAPVEEWMVRGTAIFEPHDRFTARFKMNYNDFSSSGAATPLQITYCPEGNGPIVPVANIPFIADDDCSVDKVIRLTWLDPAAFDSLKRNGEPFHEQTQAFGTLELNFDVTDALNLVSVTGYSDLDFFAQTIGSAGGTTTSSSAQIMFTDVQFTQELRLSSDFSDSTVNFMAGAFYQDAEQQRITRLPGNTFIGLPALLQHHIQDVGIRSTSIFGQVLWDVTEKLELTAGARWTDEERTHDQINLNPGNGPVGPMVPMVPRISSSNTSPEVTLTYKPTDVLTAFASYKTGFKSGSFNTSTIQPPSRDASFGDEEAAGGEVGLKALLADRQLAANLAIYYYKYDDLQVGANEVSDLGGGNFSALLRILNAASATTKGVEFDVTYSPAAIDGLTLSGALNYNHARYDSFTNAPCGNNQTISQGCDQLFNPTTGRFTSQDLSGHKLVRAPDWSGYAGFKQEMYLDNDMMLDLAAGANYVSEYGTVVIDRPGFEQGDYVKVDASLALRGRENRWEVALIGRNLTDKLTRGVCFNSNSQNGGVFGGQVSGAAVGGPAGDDEAGCSVERGREVWGRISLRF